jgi:hypothetical protein
MRQNHGRGRTGNQFDEKIVIVRGALDSFLQTTAIIPPISAWKPGWRT